MKAPFRLIFDSPRAATLNMAIDEHLLSSHSSNSAPTLRFYTWSSPAISIGYFQKTEEAAARLNSLKKILPIVRRVTGGGMVFHGEDLTFSLVVKTDNPFFSSDVKASYLKINEALRKGLREIFPDLEFADCKTVPSGRGGKERICFDNPSCYDLLIGGKKMVGSSQRRQGGAMLHQCSVFLPGNKETLAQKIVKGFEDIWRIEFKEEPFRDKELHDAQEIEKGRYSSQEWARV